MSVGRCWVVNRTLQIQVADDPRGGQVELFAQRPGDVRVARCAGVARGFGNPGNLLGMAAGRNHSPEGTLQAQLPLDEQVHGIVRNEALFRESGVQLPAIGQDDFEAEAKRAGFDPAEDAIRAACLEVFAAGSPMAGDDGVNSAFLSARLTVTGPALQKLVAAVTPRLAAALGQKLAAQAVPILGAVTGAALNAAFLRYYREMARIRFQLMRLSVQHGAEAVMLRFEIGRAHV